MRRVCGTSSGLVFSWNIIPCLTSEHLPHRRAALPYCPGRSTCLVLLGTMPYLPVNLALMLTHPVGQPAYA